MLNMLLCFQTTREKGDVEEEARVGSVLNFQKLGLLPTQPLPAPLSSLLLSPRVRW